MCVLLRIYCVLLESATSAPSVPPQQVIVRADVLVLESLAFPPEVPSSIGPDCAFWFTGWMVTVAVPDAELFACETALTVTVVVTVSAGSQANRDRKSTRLNSSHQIISYAVFCLKKKIQNSNAVRPNIVPGSSNLVLARTDHWFNSACFTPAGPFAGPDGALAWLLGNASSSSRPG